MKNQNLPKGLKGFFVLHFFVDYIFAIPMMFFPFWTMELFNFPMQDPLFMRLVAAALFGIGGVSLIARESSRESFKTMLTLKNIWSLSAILAISLTLFQNQNPETQVSLLLFLSIFVGFAFVWRYYRVRISR